MPAPGLQYPNDSAALFDDGDEITCEAAAVIYGARFVRIAGNGTTDKPYVALCGAGLSAFGVSTRDADPTGATIIAAPTDVGVWHAPHKIVQVMAGAALTAGQLVMSDATGQAIPYVAGTGVVAVGTALHDAANATKADIDRSQRT